MAPALLYSQSMSDMISTVYHLLLLQEKQEGDTGLTMDEVVDLERYEADLQGEEFGRQYRRLDLHITALIRHPGKDSVVQLLDFSPGGMRLMGCPELTPGDNVELHLRESDERSFRFPSQIMWIRAHGEQHMAGVRFVGRPIQINHGPPSDGPENIVDRIQVA
jgi:hypothetical protein